MARRAPFVSLTVAISLPREAMIAGFPAAGHLVQLISIRCAFRLCRYDGLEGTVHTTRLTRGYDLRRTNEWYCKSRKRTRLWRDLSDKLLEIFTALWYNEA